MWQGETGPETRPTRRLPNRSPEEWAKAFVETLGGAADVSFDKVRRIAAKDTRLRERVPASVVSIVRASAKALGVTPGAWVQMAQISPFALTVQEHTVRRQLKQLCKALCIGRAEAVRSVRAVPSLLSCSEGLIAKRMSELRGVVGLSLAEWRRCARRYPILLTMKPATFAKRLRQQQGALKLTAAEYGKLACREPRLMLLSTDAITRFTTGACTLWGWSLDEARRFVARTPKPLVSGTISTMDANLSALATSFGVEKELLIKAVWAFSPLAYQKPERIVEAVDAGACALGVEREVLVEAVLRSPSLVARRPASWASRMRMVLRIAEALGDRITPTTMLAKFPAAMTYGSERLLQRYVLARLGLWPWNWMALLSLSDKRARGLFAEYFVGHPEREPLRQALIRRDLL